MNNTDVAKLAEQARAGIDHAWFPDVVAHEAVEALKALVEEQATEIALSEKWDKAQQAVVNEQAAEIHELEAANKRNVDWQMAESKARAQAEAERDALRAALMRLRQENAAITLSIPAVLAQRDREIARLRGLAHENLDIANEHLARAERAEAERDEWKRVAEQLKHTQASELVKIRGERNALRRELRAIANLRQTWVMADIDQPFDAVSSFWMAMAFADAGLAAGGSDD